jgi:hypothetical protein
MAKKQKPKKAAPAPPETTAPIVEAPSDVAPPADDGAAPAELPPAAWEPPEGHIVSDEKSYHIRVGGVRYVHVGDAPDGRWVYRAD